MSTQRPQRETLALSQSEAARRAGVSLNTWRRFEQDPENVAARTRAKCARVLGAKEPVLPTWKSGLTAAWEHSHVLTPRQAAALRYTLDGWQDSEIELWLDGGDRPLHEVLPFAYFDLRVMMLVDENKAWAAKAQERCKAVSDEIQAGTLPFERGGCYFDEVLMAAAVHEARHLLEDMPELFDDFPARRARSEESGEGEDLTDDDEDVTDDDWDLVGEVFDDLAQWDDWEVPVMNHHPLLGLILAKRHPFRWFDPMGPRPTLMETATGEAPGDGRPRAHVH